MRTVVLCAALFFLSHFSFAQRNCTIDASKLSGHPRILLSQGEERQIKALIASDECWKNIHLTILNECDKWMDAPLPERKKIGRRLLSVSRKALQNIFYLSYAYRMTGEDKYFQRAEKELLAVCSFSDWNPSHFLDVGEMTMAVAIGYDWLYAKLPSESKAIIREAIVEKGIKLSMDDKYNRFLHMHNNWNQVCNAGITYGAIAVADDEPELAKSMIERAINNLYMEEYAPDGVYPEGAGYWGYGTSFGVMFLSVIEKIFATDFGLSLSPGFKETPHYLQHMIASDNRYFNYSDCGGGGSGLNATLFWFAGKFGDVSVLWKQLETLKKLQSEKMESTGDRLLPAILIWAKDIRLKDIIPPKQKMFTGQGESPVSLMRTSWTDPNAVYLGYKLGSPYASHAHMDIGSFIMVANGVRWASDFGMQNYESLESKGIKLFDRKQDGQRWQVFRYVNTSHNTLTFDNQLQAVKGYAKVDRYGEKDNILFAVSDLTDVYKKQVAAVKRGVAIVDRRYVAVRDEIQPLDKTTNIRWNMLTATKVEIQSDNTARLTSKDGKTLLLRVDAPSGAKVCTWTTKSPNSWDASNKGTIFVGFEYDAPGNTPLVLQVSLIPDTEKASECAFNHSLDNW